jgi:uncharacterized membrane protein YhiD involved in acid resistance
MIRAFALVTAGIGVAVGIYLGAVAGLIAAGVFVGIGLVAGIWSIVESLDHLVATGSRLAESLKEVQERLKELVEAQEALRQGDQDVNDDLPPLE